MSGLAGDQTKLNVNKGFFAPTGIVTASAGVPLDVELYSAVGSPDSYEYYINTDSANKITRTGLIWIHPNVTALVFTADTVLEVM